MFFRKRRREAFRNAAAYDPDNIHGKSEFASDQTIKDGNGFSKKGITVGYSKESGRPIKFSGTTHLWTIGGTGSFKTSSSLIPALLEQDDKSIVAFDMGGGEMAAVTGPHRAKLGDVYFLNPMGVLPAQLGPSARYNPMGRHWLDPKSVNFGVRASKIAAGLVRNEPGDRDRYWGTKADQLLRGITMAVAKYEGPSKVNLPHVASIIYGDVQKYCKEIVAKTDDIFIRDKLISFTTDEDIRSLREVIEHARAEVDFLLDAAISRCLTGNDFTFSDCCRRVMTVYIILPIEVQEVLGRFNKLLLACVLGELFGEAGTGPVQTLVLADELFQYGRGLDALPAAFAAARKFKTQLWGCVTHFEEIKKMFPGVHEAMLNNAGAIQWLSATDLEGSTYLSNLCGETEIRGYSKSLNYSPDEFHIVPFAANDPNAKIDTPSMQRLKKLHVTQNYTQQRRKLILPDEVRALGARDQIVFLDRVKGPILCEKRPFFETGLKYKGRPNPFYRGSKESLWKRIWEM